MIKLIALTAFLGFSFLFQNIGLCQSPSIEWELSIGGNSTDQAISVKETTDGGSIILGNTYSTNLNAIGYHGDEDFLVIKMNSTGSVE